MTKSTVASAAKTREGKSRSRAIATIRAARFQSRKERARQLRERVATPGTGTTAHTLSGKRMGRLLLRPGWAIALRQICNKHYGNEFNRYRSEEHTSELQS